jgi:hypothetical protein
MSLHLTQKEQTRPYSQDELNFERNRFFSKNRISEVLCTHNKCKHQYRVKENGKKYQEITQSGKEDCGNCSVCWKLRKTPNELVPQIDDLIEEFYQEFYDNKDSTISFNTLNLEIDFYNWLYNEFNN